MQMLSEESKTNKLTICTSPMFRLKARHLIRMTDLIFHRACFAQSSKIYGYLFYNCSDTVYEQNTKYF